MAATTALSMNVQKLDQPAWPDMGLHPRGPSPRLLQSYLTPGQQSSGYSTSQPSQHFVNPMNPMNPIDTVGRIPNEKDLLSVTAEVQHMIERVDFTPMPVSDVAQRLSMGSHRILMQNQIGLLEALLQHPDVVQVNESNGQQLVSVNGLPWLGPGPQPAKQKQSYSLQGNDSDVHSEANSSEAGQTIRLPRGKAVEMMDEIAATPMVQECLTDVASVLLQSPDKKLIISDLGNRLTAASRECLRVVKLRLAQILRCFPDDFQLHGSGPATLVSYRRKGADKYFMPHMQLQKLNKARHCRLFKLAADVSDYYVGTGVKGISASDVADNLDRYLLIDCRTVTERAVSVLPNSIAASELTDEVLQSHELLVAYCVIGNCSADWCGRIANQQHCQGWSFKLRFLTGGLASWAHHGGVFLDPVTAQPTCQVHCLVKELGPFFPLPESGYTVFSTPLYHEDPVRVNRTMTALSHASRLRHARLRNLAWQVRLRHWPAVFCIEAEDLFHQLSSGDIDGMVLVDCRTPDETSVSTLDGMGAIQVTKEEFEPKARKLIQTARTVVTFCTIGGRSGMYNEKLSAELITQGVSGEMLEAKFVNLVGGIAAWLQVKGRLKDPQNRHTWQVHPWCHAFLDLFPIENLEIVCDEACPVPMVAKGFAQYMQECESNPSQSVLQMYNALPTQAIDAALKRASEQVYFYDD